MRRSRWLSLPAAGLAVAAFPFLLLACSSDKPPAAAAAKPKAAAAPTASASATTKAAPEYAESDFVENDKRPLKLQRRVILSQFSLDELKLVAIVQGGDYPRAMVVPPGGKGAVIKRGDFIGRAETVHTGGTNGTDYQVNWRVDRVRDGDVVLVREDPAQPNIPPATRVIPLHPEGEKNADLDLNGEPQL